MLGKPFGHRQYVATILKDVEEEVHRNPALRYKFPWFDDCELAAERLAAIFRLSEEEKAKLDIAQGILHGWVLGDVDRFTKEKRSPPSLVDCRVLAFGQIREAIVVTDDLAMHDLAAEFDIDIWHGPELLRRMRTGKLITNDVVREIYDALERNQDQTETWKQAKHTTFSKVFGALPKG